MTGLFALVSISKHSLFWYWINFLGLLKKQHLANVQKFSGEQTARFWHKGRSHLLLPEIKRFQWSSGNGRKKNCFPQTSLLRKTKFVRLGFLWDPLPPHKLEIFQKLVQDRDKEWKGQNSSNEYAWGKNRPTNLPKGHAAKIKWKNEKHGANLATSVF